MILTAASYVYGTAASWRRRWYATDSSRQRRLRQPVISIGNLSTGGTGKTPLVAQIAVLLKERGERPAILSRGYARTTPEEGVTVVSDTGAVRASLDRSGDEPLMLARALPGVPVVVGSDRYAAGLYAEQQLDATVLLLDDGFQHLRLARDVNLLIAGTYDLGDRVLPAGRLREPLAAAAAADALLVYDATAAEHDRLRRALGVTTVFRCTRALGPPRWADSHEPAPLTSADTVFAVAGIARPERFFADLAAAGVVVAATEVFPDHHRYTKDDLLRIAAAARRASAKVVVTTEKDAVRLPLQDQPDLRVAVVPLKTTIEPAFAEWLGVRLGAVRAARPPRRPHPATTAVE